MMRLSRSTVLSTSLLVFAAALPLKAQAVSHGDDTVEAGVNYNWLHANAPAGQCGCFSANGGSGTIAYRATHSFRVVADISGVQASGVSGTTQNLTLLHYLFGVRYDVPTHSRFVPYAQGLLGAAHEASNYAYVQSSTAFAFSLGGGVRVPVARHVGITLVQADWIHSQLPNAANGKQNDTRIATGVYVRFGSK